MMAVKVMRTSNNDDNDATMPTMPTTTLTGRGGGGRTTRLPIGGGGSYYPHHRMSGAAHGFVWPPQRFAAEMTTMAASAGGPAGSLRLRACRQAQHATARNDEDEDEDEDNRIQRATKALAAGGRRHNHR